MAFKAFFFSTGIKIPTNDLLNILPNTESWGEKLPATEYQTKFWIPRPALVTRSFLKDGERRDAEENYGPGAGDVGKPAWMSNP